MRKRQLLLVEWEDTGTLSRWRDEKDSADFKELRCFTVGWKLKSKPRHLHIASTRNNVDECSDMTVIPRKNIVSIRRLE